MRRRLSGFWQRHSPQIVAVIGLVTMVLVAANVTLWVRVSDQAQAGVEARLRQCETYPAISKVVRGAARYRIIDRAELDRYLAVGPPTGCGELSGR